jgi:hypothetical protein
MMPMVVVVLAFAVAAATVVLGAFFMRQVPHRERLVTALISSVIAILLAFLTARYENYSEFRFVRKVSITHAIEPAIDEMIRTGDRQFRDHRYAVAAATYDRALHLIGPILAREGNQSAISLLTMRSELEVKYNLARIGVRFMSHAESNASIESYTQTST